MPPQPPLLSSIIRAYVCRSCLSKLQKLRQPRPLWLARQFTNDDGPQGAKRPKPTVSNNQQNIPEPVIKYWEQAADGQRREKGLEDNSFVEKLESSIKELEDEIGDTSLLEKQDAERELLGEEENDDVEGDLESHIREGMNLPSSMESQIAELKVQMRWLEEDPDLENLSPEDRARIRDEVLNGISGTPSDTPSAIPSPPSKNTSTIKSTTLSDPPTQLPAEAYDQDLAVIPSPESVMISLEEYPSIRKRKLVTLLNSSLLVCMRKLEEKTLDDAEQKAAWTCYSKCRSFLLEMPETVPSKTWPLLWDIFEQPGIKNFGRLEHIFRLGRDMQEVGIGLSAKQNVLFIESQFVAGYPEEAIAEWEDAARYVAKDLPAVNDYWSLGVRMYAQNGDGETALDVLSNYLSKVMGTPDFRLLIPVIRGYLSMGSEKHNHRAWIIYKQLLYYLGSDITMEDYDAVTTLFIDAGLPERALDVFKDMMLRGENPTKRALGDALRISLRAGADLVHRVRVDLPVEKSATLAVLPPHFINKYFFGKWVKKLIGEGRLDAAKQVFDLMGVRGIRPDARFLNGLIGAFYREGSSDKQKLAEDLAWRMIATRLEFVKKRDSTFGQHLDLGLKAVPGYNKSGIKSPFQTPRATIETFSILIEQYRRRQKQDLVPNLLVTLQQAKIPPNTFFMNQLIMTDMASPQGPWAWDTYRTMFSKQKVNPDFDTFTYFWEIMRKASGPATNLSGEGVFVSCRTLFSEMIQRSDILCRKEEMPRAVYDILILSFCLSRDQAGTAVALRAIERRFGLYPDENTARTIILQLSKLGLRDKQGRYSRRLSSKKTQHRNRVIEVGKIMARFKQERVNALLEKGIDFDELNDDTKREESILLLTDMLKFVAQSRLDAGIYGDLKTPSELSKIAAQQMGVPDCDPWAVRM